MTQELSIITHAYDLQLWTLQHTARFPRSHRHQLGRRIEDKLHALLEALLEAKFTTDKSAILRQAALRLEEIRWLLRLATDLRLLAARSQGHAVARLQEIGRQLAAWRRTVDARR